MDIHNRRVTADLTRRVKLVASIKTAIVPSEVSKNAPLALLVAREDETGLLFGSGEVEALAAAFDRLATLPDARLTQMRAAGRRSVEQDFTATRYRNRLLKLSGSLNGASERPERLS